MASEKGCTIDIPLRPFFRRPLSQAGSGLVIFSELRSVTEALLVNPDLAQPEMGCLRSSGPKGVFPLLPHIAFCRQ